ncbi:hypothetical protein CEP52_017728 [Fusarium oligoseptatum]|uniref:Uncharacterized protein n=1 Tax=Fusarium oligoseptatum TaxID=2604345 RepID=A0A428RIB8_9HYPO|nr:hypothetical protein CEP52_017728 [Fusarium oligoseptatum]
MEHLHGPNGNRAASPDRQQVNRGPAPGNFQRLTSDSSMHDSVATTATEEDRHSEPCFERGAAAGYQQRITAEANAPDASTLRGPHANRFTRQAVKTGRTVARLRCEKDGSLEEANNGSASTRNKFLDEDGELYLPTIAELMIMAPEDWAEFYDAFDSQGPRSH